MDGHHQALLDFVFEVLGDKAAVHDNKLSQNSKVKDFWDHGYQAIVFYQRHDQVKEVYGGKVWPMWRIQSPWPESNSAEDLYNKLDDQVRARLPARVGGFVCRMIQMP